MSSRLIRVLPLSGLFLSGAAGLVYEVVWSRAAATLFGSVLTATGSLLALFMAGLGLGSAIGARWAARVRRPLLAFGAVEVAVGCLAATTPACSRPRRHWSCASTRVFRTVSRFWSRPGS